MNWRNLPGTLTEDGAETLAQQISKLPEGSSVVEVGRDGGRETLLIAETIKNSGKHIKFFSVGLDKDAGELHETINFCGVGRFVKVIDDDPVEVADLFESDSVDFLFVHPTTKDAMFEWVSSRRRGVVSSSALGQKSRYGSVPPTASSNLQNPGPSGRFTDFWGDYSSSDFSGPSGVDIGNSGDSATAISRANSRSTSSSSENTALVPSTSWY
jgi:hypothetical protein